MHESLADILDDEVEGAPACLFCGEPEFAELHEIWSSREFMMDTCCHGMYEAVAEFLAADPRQAAAWLNNKGLAAVAGIGRARRVLDDDGQLIIDWNLEVQQVSQRDAKAFVRDHHRHCPPPAGWRFGAGVRNGFDLVAVAMVGRPVARGFDPEEVVEVNRLTVREDLPDGITWNACSLLYGWAARQAKKRGFSRIITYTRADEPGTTLRAAGWEPEAHVRGRSWDTVSRRRQDKSDIIDKIRWVRVLRAAPQIRHPLASAANESQAFLSLSAAA